jgi:hypothetical protein
MIKRKRTFVKRYAASAAGNRGLNLQVRNFMISSLVVVIAVFSLTLIGRYAAKRVHLNLNFSFSSPFARPKYFIQAENLYVVYSDGSTKMAENNMDRSEMPVLSGIITGEKRPEYRKAYRQILKLDKKYLAEISEINARRPDSVVLITVSGKRILAGAMLDNEMMKNYVQARDRLKKMRKPYSLVDMRFKDKIVIR